MIDAHEAAEPAPKKRKKSAKAVIGHALAGFGVGLAAGALGGGIFMLQYSPHGGGPVGDWTSIVAFAGAVVVGGPLGLLGGIVSAVSGFKLRWLFASLGGLGVLAGVVLIIANLQ